MQDATLADDAEAKVSVVAKDYEHMANAALEQVRAARAKAEAAT